MRIALLGIGVLTAISQAAAPVNTIELGRASYRSNCAFCHGMAGEGGRGPALVRRSLIHGDTDAAFRKVIRSGVPGSSMPSFRFEPQEMSRLVAFLLHMRGASKGMEKVEGDAKAGAALYRKLGCATCHRIGEEGSVYGPDLSRIGASRSLGYLRDSLVKPSADVVQEYEGVTVVTRDGKKISGARVNEDTFTVQLRDPSQRFLSFSKDELRDVVHEKQSLMPAYDKLSKQEIDDLVAFMEGLRGERRSTEVKKVEGIR